MTKKTKEHITGILWAVVKANLIAWGLFILSAIFIRAIADSYGMDSNILFLVIGLVYLLVYDRIYIRQRDELYLDKGIPFSYSAEAAAYFRKEGKYFSIILGVLALVCEIEMIAKTAVMQENARFLFTTICVFLFPLVDMISVPVLRMVICYLFATGAVLLLQLFRSRKVWKSFDKRDALPQ